MRMCWSIKPMGRPSFADIVQIMEKLLESNEDYIELKDYNESEYISIPPSSNELCWTRRFQFRESEPHQKPESPQWRTIPCWNRALRARIPKLVRNNVSDWIVSILYVQWTLTGLPRTILPRSHWVSVGLMEKCWLWHWGRETRWILLNSKDSDGIYPFRFNGWTLMF